MKEHANLHSKLSSMPFSVVLPGLVNPIIGSNSRIRAVFNSDRQQHATRPYELRGLCAQIQACWPEVAETFMKRFREPRRFSTAEQMYGGDEASFGMPRFHDPNCDGRNRMCYIRPILSYFRITCGLGFGKQ